MNIVYVADKKYLGYFEMSYTSLKQVHPNAKVWLISTYPFTGEGWENIVVDSLNIPQQKNSHISPAAYLKLLIPELLPDLDKCLFLDCDTIVQKTLTGLYNRKVPYLGMTRTFKEGSVLFKRYHQKETSITNEEVYARDVWYLSGMMLMNLKALRESDYLERLKEYFTHSDLLFREDESILDICFYDWITEVPVKYNYCKGCKYPEEYSIDEEDAYILHIVGKDKRYMDDYFHIPFNEDVFNISQVLSYLKGKTVAVVGNAPYILEEEYGKEIDNHDIVIRFNQGYPRDNITTGLKTNILYTAIATNVNKFVNEDELYCVISRDLFNSKMCYDVLDTRSNTEYNRMLKMDSVKSISSGTRVILMCLLARVKSIDVYGFDYTTIDSYCNNADNQNAWHDFKGEFSSLCAYDAKQSSMTRIPMKLYYKNKETFDYKDKVKIKPRRRKRINSKFMW